MRTAPEIETFIHYRDEKRNSRSIFLRFADAEKSNNDDGRKNISGRLRENVTGL